MLAGAMVVLCQATVVGAGEPELFNVLTPRVIESFQEVTASSQRLEEGLSGSMDLLKRQMTTYDESGCLRDGIEDQDVGCLEQFRALRETYTAFLTQLRVALPEIEDRISFATSKMKSSIQSSANNSSAGDLWESLKGTTPAKISGRGPLSNRMRRILDAIHQRGSRVSPAALSLEIYADLAATQDIIALIQAAVIQQEMLLTLPDEALVAHDSELADTIGKVQLAIFGEEPLYMPDLPPPVDPDVPEDWGG